MSQIEAYLNCPKKYEMTYVHGVREPASIEQVEGSIMHAVFEASNCFWLDEARHMTPKQALVVWKKEAKKLFETVEDWKREKPKLIQKRAEGFIEQLFDEPDFEPEDVGAVEEEFAEKIAGIEVRGIIDLREKGQIIDLKVCSMVDYYDVARSLQSVLYRVVRNKPQFKYVFCEKRSGRVKTDYHVVRDAMQLRPYVEYVVASVARAISMGVFPLTDPTKNSLCSERFCMHWRKCVGSMQV